MRIALAGNPNSGKTTAFNHYTGAHQHVANYPGITVEKKEGEATVNGRKVLFVDLPGTYSLTAYSQDELVARRGLSENAPDCVIDVINAGALERNLYLAVQIMEMGLPIVLALNLYDEVRHKGTIINCERLSELLGVPVFPTVARSGEGMDDVLHAAVLVADECRSGHNKSAPWKGGPSTCSSKELTPDEVSDPHNFRTRSNFSNDGNPLIISYGPDLDPVLDELTAMIDEAKFLTDRYNASWIALKYVENDDEIRRLGRLANCELAEKMEKRVETLAKHLRSTLNTYPEAVIADYRYGFISSILRNGVISHRNENRARMDLSEKMDKVLTHRLFGPIIMLGIIWAMYEFVFFVGEIPKGWLEDFFDFLSTVASAGMEEGLLRSLVVSGIIAGVGGVLSFVPLIVFMFLLISFLEDSGYMARMAFMLDRIFRAFGLHGYSVMPFIVSGGIAGGCAVPGVMATRTLRSPKEKLATMLTAPFMNCGAKMPVFLMLVAAFFDEHKTTAMVCIWVGSWVFALLVARLLRSTLIRGAATPFVMELPPYRLPTLFGVIYHTWERIWQYIKKAGTIILAVSVLLWAAMNFPALSEDQNAPYEAQIAAISEKITAAEENKVPEDELEALNGELEDVQNEQTEAALVNSVGGRVGTALESVTRYAGFDWRTNIALVGGLAAKEVVVATLGTAYSLGEVDPEESAPLQDLLSQDPHWNKANAASLIVFTMLYAPCFVTVVMIKQESGSAKWALFSVVFNTLLAFVMAVIVYHIGLLLLNSGVAG